jgi:ATP-dependent RNA helicase RhlE
MSETTFAALGLDERILKTLAGRHYSKPTPIQEQAIPHILEGRDLLGIAQTGTGKTAAFALPILQRLAHARAHAGKSAPKALVLAPTRELAIQIHDEMRSYGQGLGLTYAVVMGGVGQGGQVAALRRGVEILIATPGRLLDLMEQRLVRLDRADYFVLDEADRMLDMGFITDVRKIIPALPQNRHSLFFSATMPPTVSRLANEILNDPIRVEATPPATTVDSVDQQVYFVASEDKVDLLSRLLEGPDLKKVLVFSRTKHRANKVAQQLDTRGFGADAIHGNKSQGARQRALQRFRQGDARVLVATDIAARGIDVEGVTHVINFELPMESESYVHRIGRTARAGASGSAISFCDRAEIGQLRAIERLIGVALLEADGPAPVVWGAAPRGHAGQGRPSGPRRGGPQRQPRSGGNGGGGSNRPQRRRPRPGSRPAVGASRRVA